MTATPAAPRPPAGGLNWERLFPAMVALVVGLAAISTQSFWMDEAVTALIAGQPSPAAWWRFLSLDGGSDTQMPFYMLYVWLWDKLFDSTEWWLRAANLPWLMLGFLAIPRRQIYFFLALAVSPFLWFYTNEARPYAMQVGAGLILIGSLWRLLELSPNPSRVESPGKFPVVGFCFGLIVLAGSSLLGMIWAGAMLAAALAVLGWPRAIHFARQNLPVLAVTALSLILLALFYLWSLKRGNHPTPGKTGISNVFFVTYELTGFSGFGPGRLDIRSSGLAAFYPFLVPLALEAAMVTAVFFAGAKWISKKISRQTVLGVAVALGAASCLLLVAGVATHFRLLGRHFAPLAPWLLLVFALGLRQLDERGGWRKFWLWGFLLLSLGSALSLRFCARHAKDDYRGAAALAVGANARGERVWWCADAPAAVYYHVPLAYPQNAALAPGLVWLMSNPPAETLTNPPPDVLLFSRPEFYDQNGRMRDYLERNHYQVAETLPAFTVWRPKKR